MHRHLSAALAALLLLLAPAAWVAAQDQDANAPSRAGVTDAVVAGGVAPLPAPQAAWRVVRDTAEPRGQATFQQRALGFAVATKDAVLETDQATGARRRLAAREASFVADGARVMRESLGAGATPYYRLALVPPEKAGDAGGDTLVFAGKPFTAPAGDQEIDLIKGNLYATGRDDAFRTDPDVPLLVLVLDGEIQIKANGKTATLKAGQAGAYAGAVTLHSTIATGAGATFVAAVIGPAIPAASAAAAEPPTAAIGPAETATTTGQAATGEIIAVVFACPAGTRAPNPSTCPLIFSGYDFALQSLTDPSAPTRTLADATKIQDGGVDWSGLPFGAYDLVESGLPPGYASYDAPGYERIAGTAMTGLKVTIDAAHPSAVVKIFDFKAQAAGTGNVRILTVDPAGKGLGGACYALSGPASYGPVCDGDAQDTAPDAGDVGFDGVAAGHYTLTETTAPAGYDPAADQEIDVIPAIQLQPFTVQNAPASGTPTS